jgi:hypothetical protein
VSDVRNIVGDDGDPAELERLQRLHELLERVGPPPELSPALASAPDPPAARVIPFPRRYRFTAAAAAAVAAAVLFGVGYLVGKAPGETVEQTVAMSGNGATAELDLFDVDAAGNWPMELHVRGLGPGRYELWLTRDGELAETCGQFVVAEGETTVPLNAPYRLRDFDGWVVVRFGMQEPLLTTV